MSTPNRSSSQEVAALALTGSEGQSLSWQPSVPESVNDSAHPIEVDEEEVEVPDDKDEDSNVRLKRKLKREFKRVKVSVDLLVHFSPLFKMVTRNTIRKDIMKQYEDERKRAIDYMAANKSKVAITTDMWVQITKTPHTAEVIVEELNASLVAWNLDEKVSTVTVDNCSTNDKFPMFQRSLFMLRKVRKTLQSNK
ncbi:hypothetical protein E2562_030495, partial [Oryza meyeriana var. granulata]